MKRFLYSFLEVVEVALIAVISVFLVRTFLVQPFLVSGESMAPNFSDGDYLLVDELTYYFRTPGRGEVAVFRYPSGNGSTYFIKRVIGLPGEKVKISEGKIYIFNQDNPQGFLLAEDYLPQRAVTAGDAEFKIDGENYFVLGDNRSYSFDSRSWGLLNKKEIVGLARLRLWPLAHMKAFAAPQY
ncbi:MAG: signal peptidase I [Patescibacteria group bacterium]